MITDVSDTALWVATYRAIETERPDALFRDPLAARLAGERGRQIAAHMSRSNRTAWTVVIRTCIIDDYILKLISEGIDTVINLGAGLDTRPYRMNLPATLRWIEVDYPHMIQLKEQKLADQKPQCQLRRIGVDLADDSARQKLFAELGAQTKKAMILTEGVVLYLKEDQVASLARDLQGQPHFCFWVLEYLSPQIMNIIRGGKRKVQMQNAPLQFSPTDWFGFFRHLGWVPREIRYMADVGQQLGREMPVPWWVKVLRIIMSAKRKNTFRTSSGYVLLEPKKDTLP